MSSIAKRPNGKWRARYRDNDGVEHARHFPTRGQGQRWLDEITADLLTGRYVDPRAGQITLGEYYRTYRSRQVWEPTTRRSVDHAVAACPLNTLALGHITSADVERWIKEMDEQGLAAATIRTRVAAIKAVLAGAVRERLRHDNPATGVRLPRTMRRPQQIRLPTPGQVAALIEGASPRLAVAIDLAAHAGLRLGELRGLRVADLGLGAGVLHVRRQVRDVPADTWREAPPKYGQVRAVSLLDDLTRRLRAHLTDSGLRFTPEAFVVPGTDGRPVHATTLARHWQATKQKAGIGESGLRLHDLRHYFASMLIAHGRSVIEVQLAMGHARPSTTLDLYGHQFHTATAPVVETAPFRVNSTPGH